jgi:hypothetical protein
VGAIKLGDLCADIESAAHAGDLAVIAALLPDYQTEIRAVDQWLSNLYMHNHETELCA